MDKFKEIDAEARADQAVAYFKEGYNCAQAVYMSYADLFGMDLDFAAKVVAPLGGGMGRLREVCGTVSGMFMVAGLRIPANNPADKEAKAKNYAMVQKLAEQFRETNGSIICRELLGLKVQKELPVPEERTATYYERRPCAEYVRIAAHIVGNELKRME